MGGLKRNTQDWVAPLIADQQMSMQGYFEVLAQTPARTLLEGLGKKNWNFKTPFTHGLRHF